MFYKQKRGQLEVFFNLVGVAGLDKPLLADVVLVFGDGEAVADTEHVQQVQVTVVLNRLRVKLSFKQLSCDLIRQ